jgi:uncharacterized protein YneF (UPF0154 family)
MIEKIKVSAIWRILAIWLLGFIMGMVVCFKIMKKQIPSNSTVNNTEISIDKIKNSEIENIEITSDSKQNQPKKRKKGLFRKR